MTTQEQTRLLELAKADAREKRVPLVVVDCRHLGEHATSEQWLSFDGYLREALAKLTEAQTDELCRVVALRPVCDTKSE